MVLERNDYKGIFSELSSAILSLESLVDTSLYVNSEKLKYVQKGAYSFTGTALKGEQANNIKFENCEFKTSYGDASNALIGASKVTNLELYNNTMYSDMIPAKVYDGYNFTQFDLAAYVEDDKDLANMEPLKSIKLPPQRRSWSKYLEQVAGQPLMFS